MDEAKYSDRLADRPDDIAIVGYAFRLPQDVDDDFTFWDVLQKRRNLRTDWPASRINVDAFKLHGKGGHFISEDVAAFDAPFFSLTAKEAAAMDPMQRWTLETSYHAFENAGMPAGSLRGSRTAVFSASMLEDYARMTAMDPGNTERTAVTGSTVASVIPNRVSWYFDLRGPSIHVNTACSSALSAVDMACKSLQAGDSSCALVTGANLLLDPGVFHVLSNGGFLSPDGVCHSFDHRANGYARGEGFIALVLKPIAAAVRDGDVIRAVIRAVGSNQDGNTPVLTQPSAQAQEDLIRHVYERAGLPFDQTRYVEAHGTGTRVGDPIEVRAIGRVFGDFRSAEEPMFVGSVKANVGHLEGASALASIVKAILILEKGVITGQALLEKLNPDIDADMYHIAVPLKDTVWPSPGLRRISVNSFGFGGSNSHAILDDALHYMQERGLRGHHCTVSGPLVSNADAQASTLDGEATRLPKLLVWSAADEGGLNRMIRAYESYYQDRVAGDPSQLDRLAFTLAARRSRMLWRAFSIVINDGAETKSLPRPSEPTRSSAEVGLAWVFTGQGAQYAHMGYALCRYSVFRQTLEQVDEIYRSLGAEWSLFDELRNPANIDKPEYSQPLTTAVQVALVELLRSFGVIPKGVVGHSSGEIAAAYAIGALSLASACKVAFFRGLLAGKLRAASASTPQAMISVNLAEDQVPDYLSQVETSKTSAASSVCVACINSPLNCTLSGPEAAIDAIKAQADRDGIFAQKLRTGVAYHSPSMLAIAGEYLTLMGHLEGGATSKASGGSITMVSSVTGKELGPGELAKPQYWVGNMVSTVRFSDAVRTLLTKFESSITDLVEVGPHPALRRPARDTMGKEQQIRYAGVLDRSRPATETMLELVGGLFSLGYGISIPAVNHHEQAKPAPQPLVDCPPYPFDHSHRYWGESRLSRDFRLRGTVQGETLGARVSDWNPLAPRWRNFLSIESSPWLDHHKVRVTERPHVLCCDVRANGRMQISDTVLYPAAGMLIMAIEAVQQHTARAERTVTGYQLEQVEFLNPIIVPEAWEDRTETQVHLQPARKKENSFDVSIFSYSPSGQWSECFHAGITVEYQAEPEEEHKQVADEAARTRQAEAQRDCRLPLDSEVFYHDAAEHGLQYGDWFQLLREIRWDGRKTAVAQVDMSRQRYRSESLVHPALLDTAFHVLRASAGQQRAANVPVRLDQAWFSATGWQHPSNGELRWLATSNRARRDKPDQLGETGTLQALAANGTVLCTIKTAVTAPVSKTTAAADQQVKDKKLLHNMEWKPQLSLLSPQQLAAVCHAHVSALDETAIVSHYAKLCAALDLAAVRILKHLDRSKIPQNHLLRHVDWMEHHVATLPAARRQEGETINDADLETRLREVEEVLPAWKLYTACARQLGSILAGEADPLQVVFESELANVFYANLFLNLCADGRLAAFLELASHENPGMRILEVGAGTGGMTGHVLNALQAREARTGAPSFAEYRYTDISPAFFERARNRWPDLHQQGRMTFQALDLDRPVETQGLEAGAYDMIIAASVLHATPYLEATLRNVRTALKPGGRLVLVEVINPADVATNFMAGLVPGWWVAREEWRPHSAAVTEPMWDKLLRANGFSGNDVLLRDYKSEECHIMSVIVSTARQETKVQQNGVSEPNKPKRRAVLVVDETPSEEQMQLARLVGGRLGPGWETPTVSPFAPEELSQTLSVLTGDDAVVCLAEVGNRPLLANLSEQSFACLQQLIKGAPRLLWATAPSAADDPLAAHYGAVQGFLRTIRAEQPSSRLVSVAIDDCSNDATCAESIARAFRTAFEPSPLGVEPKEVEYVVRDGLLMTGRAAEYVAGNETLRSTLQPQPRKLAWADAPALQLSMHTSGNNELLWIVQDLTHDPEAEIGPDEAEIEAKAWSLSQDIVDNVAASRISDDEYSQTEERMSQSSTGCAGIITRVGRNVDQSLVRPGDRVCMLLPPGEDMRKYMRAHHLAVTKLPPAGNLSFEVCAASLVPAMAAYHALIDVARLKPGMSVLVHRAADATAQMAVRIARAHGAIRVFATASSPREKQFVVDTLGLPAEDVLLSRPAAAFASGVRTATHGAGVDVVFNNAFLGDDALLASCECLARAGCFVEAGHANLASGAALPMSVFAKNITFSAAHLSELSRDSAAGLAARVMELLGESSIQPPQPLRVFDVSQANEAVQHVKTTKALGEWVVIRPRDEDMVSYFVREERHWRFDGQGSYLIAGGSGGLGRAIVRWMADRGAKHIIIASRSGATSEAARGLLAELGARDVNVVAVQCDVSSESSLAGMLEECTRRGMPPVRGCINAAMVLQDAVFQDSMTFGQWDLTMRSKVQSSYNLHRLLPHDLDFFVLLSSLAGVLGQMGSANYAAGCAFQDALARHRLAHGQRALSLDIGWMKNIGIVAETSVYQRQRQRAEDMQPIDAGELLAVLTLTLDPASPLPMPIHGQPGQLLFGLRTPADLLAQGRAVPAVLERPLFAAFSSKATAVGAASPSSSAVASSAPDDSVLFRRAAVGSRERSMIVRRALASKLARAMLIAPEDVEPTKPLSAYGVDSLMAVELRNWFAKDFGANVAVFDIMGGVPIAKIAETVAAKSNLT
ncbi:polyketide synthase [Chaetomium strumarium]|uniref:Polyketide synthase n=1 Tax=Chaetomium strumarium TaxID=1170767 RepID=A0AAJ0GN68_9PEZI|nr:polyketide synthase [Chaetomium strumarium]